MSGTTTLERIESFLPERGVRIDDLAGSLGLRRAEIGVFRKIYGLDRLRFDPRTGLFDLVLPAARQALKALPEGRTVEYVIYAHTMQTLTPPHIDAAQVIREELGLYEAEAFALTQQACVSSLGAIDLAGELLRAEAPEGAYALMVTGERAYSPKVRLIPNSAIMADAAAACLLTTGGPGDLVRSHVTRTLGEFAAGLEMTKEETQAFGRVYATVLGEVIHEAVAAAGLGFDDIDLVVPHNVNTVSWRGTIKEMGADPAKFFLANVERYSHTYASDVFVNYTTLREAGRLVDGNHYVLVSVGLGATFGAMVITHRKR
ncbi:MULTISPECIES: 3-oxoacyl-[acyl-carrier-protein] synthase III C-terminal domain-containing protein [Streptomycetaceae]|uniref:3-oxoacyl-(ACP) synthase III n=1 Tax=Streptantibioticus cattleyicolor (strain ATCC 35852 / DSM 46488 / JCM 4925 / NBRC 14057 / NRRL 8057) TaxID=1003195 RepID=F8JRD4_STREN|nr:MULTISPECIES: 3-oxoacyl-[acyl-carrier-protein] synthase III C-terminal domain-containing protein [Streptomycetaceae]AEW96634.1 3-oxoacyl-(ACP) synthase III [Streptantibioticus cattleyicolor NRRL 8057 = DSM 46488]MYS61127.1 3-oxoacyl-ACP synthase [Streptomyces sp. SID5468]CCB76972.1 putative 3-Oxoacyl-(Acyl-carrier-protein (ACP)) synthase III domain protein [Streptantibioticus cattleyicolor NRRL 8057 = DSM 46488]